MTYDVEYNKLPEDIKASNIAAAKRIPDVLSHASLQLIPQDNAGATAKTKREIDAIIEQSIEQLAEAEHNGWMEEKYDADWRYGAIRDNEKKIHPSLMPYNALSDYDKNKDKDAVRKYPEIVRMAGFKIAKMR